MNQMVTRKSLSPEDVFATIKRARGSNAGWVVVANSVEAFRKSGDWRDYYPSPTDWLNAAAKEAGVTTNTLRRMISAAEFLKVKSPATFEQGLKASPQSPKLAFGTVELIKRINDISPDEADKSLHAHLDDRLSFRQAKRIYDSLFIEPTSDRRIDKIFGAPPFGGLDPAKAASRRSHARRNSLRAIIESQFKYPHVFDPFSGGGIAFYDNFKFDYVRPDVIAAGLDMQSQNFIDGYDVKRLPAGSSQTQISKILSDVSFASTFFRHYWIILDAEMSDAENFSKMVKAIALNNVGVALLVAGNPMNVRYIKKPSNGPNPDRRDLALKKFLQSDRRAQF